MSSIIRHLRTDQMRFQKVFATLCNSKSAWQVWSDFVELSAVSISNTVEFRESIRQQREEIYMNIIGKYDKGERMWLAELIAVTAEALDNNPEQDFLGEMFMTLELGSHWHGQFFSPYHITAFMAQISTTTAKEKIEQEGYIVVNDCACGAGATLIAARNQLHKAGVGGTQALFVGQDIDRVAGLMCYIQLSLLGCAGYVVISNTLSHPVSGPALSPALTEEQDGWFMPMFYCDPIWTMRRIWGKYPQKSAE